MNDEQFLAGMWQRAEMLRHTEAEQADAQKRSRTATRQMRKRTLLYSATALALLGLCLLALLLTRSTTFMALVPAVYLPFCLALFWDGRMFSEKDTAAVLVVEMNKKGVSTR